MCCRPPQKRIRVRRSSGKETESAPPSDHQGAGDSEKESAPAKGSAARDSTRAKETEEGRHKRKRNPQMEVQDLNPDPPLRRHLIFDQAHRLATMPRKRYDDALQSAFWSALVSLPGAIAGLSDILAKAPTQPKLFDVAEVTIFAVCLALCISALVKRGDIKTSQDYLNELYQIAPQSASSRWRKLPLLWHRDSSPIGPPTSLPPFPMPPASPGRTSPRSSPG
jgi:hypothetical protein